MTSLRQRMTEDMQVRNLALNTQTSYVQQVSLFARHFNKSPEQLGPEDIRAYQVYLTNERKLAPGSILIAVAALRFLYKVSLKKDWSFEDVIPAPKKPQKLPVVLSPEEVLQFLDCVGSTKHRAILTTCYAAGLRISEAVRLKPSRHRQPAHGHSRRAGQGPEGSLRDAVAQTAGNPAELLSGRAAAGLAVPGRCSRPTNHQKCRRTSVPEGPSPFWHSQADYAPFAAARLRGSPAGIRNRCPHHPTAARPSQPGDHGPIPADRHQQGVLYIQSARPAPSSRSR